MQPALALQPDQAQRYSSHKIEQSDQARKTPHTITSRPTNTSHKIEPGTPSTLSRLNDLPSFSTGESDSLALSEPGLLRLFKDKQMAIHSEGLTLTTSNCGRGQKAQLICADAFTSQLPTEANGRMAGKKLSEAGKCMCGNGRFVLRFTPLHTCPHLFLSTGVHSRKRHDVT